MPRRTYNWNIPRFKDGAVRTLRTKNSKKLTHLYAYACIFNRSNIAGLTYTSETIFTQEGVEIIGMPLVYMAQVNTEQGLRWGQETVGNIAYTDIDDFGFFILAQLAPPKALSPIAAKMLDVLDIYPFGLALSSIKQAVEEDKTRKVLTKYPILGVQLYHRTPRELEEEQQYDKPQA